MRSLAYGLLALIAWAGFAWASLSLRDHPRHEEESNLRVRLPPLVQLAYAGGDPYLAANLNVFRSLMVDASVRESETYRVQAALQSDAAIFNPYHEDNYYIAAAILPWNGEVAASQEILSRATNARTWDMWPPFFYAFNFMYFYQDMPSAGHWAEVAAVRHPRNAAALRAMAAAWYERGNDPNLALNLLAGMREQSQDENFRALLDARIQRLQGLLQLRQAASAFREANQKPAERLEQLLGYGELEQLPIDPLGIGYGVDEQGHPILLSQTKR